MKQQVEAEASWADSLQPRVPQKYLENVQKYRVRGGLLQLEEDIGRFAHNDQTRFFAFCLVFDQLVKDGISGDFAELGAN